MDATATCDDTAISAAPASAPSLLTLGALAERTQRLPSGRLCPRTLQRWVTAGVTVGGTLHRLRAERWGGQWFTCEAWLAEFVEELTSAARGEAAP